MKFYVCISGRNGSDCDISMHSGFMYRPWDDVAIRGICNHFKG